MGDMRILTKAEADFDRAAEMTDVKAAILLMAQWVGRPIMEEEVERCNPRTGEWEHTGKFKPGRVWDGVLWLDDFCNCPNLGKKSPLYTSLRRAIKKGETVSVGDWIAHHIPEQSEGGFGSMADQGGTTSAHLRIIKPRPL